MTLKDRVKTLAQERGISLPALESELGFGNSTIVKWDKSTPNADKLNAVAKYFGVTMDYLLNGENKDSLPLTTKDERDIEKIINQTKEQLLSQEGLMFDGDPASPEAVESILAAMQIGMEMAKKKNKAPKGYTFHKTKAGDTMYMISQIYGIKLAKLLQYNYMENGEKPQVGEMISLRGPAQLY